jgi:hypothetical protein
MKPNLEDLPLSSVLGFIESRWQDFLAYLESEEGADDAEALATEYTEQLRDAAGMGS